MGPVFVVEEEVEVVVAAGVVVGPVSRDAQRGLYSKQGQTDRTHIEIGCSPLASSTARRM